ncbi:MAG: hypothetical protein QF824_03290 [Candidatus Woesearchaeota archaeon]|jgi:hypothetical protein|nr:hypothetical protein [Candidatus Woesearchaeota archaeon]|tara:strand:- start:557 stop:1030 length:474 start_codon:yes stop_codon:yes gene_type:complete
MSFMDKLMFWKKSDDFGKDLEMGLDKGLAAHDAGMGGPGGPGGPGTEMGGHDPGLGGQGMGMGGHDPGFGAPPQQPSYGQSPSMGQPPQQMAPPQQFQQPAPPMMPQQQGGQEVVGKDFEIVSSKLDGLRATLESINQRLANLERVAYGEHDRKKEW